jgi:hypothetical protein
MTKVDDCIDQSGVIPGMQSLPEGVMGADQGWRNRGHAPNHHRVLVGVLQCDERLASNVSRLRIVKWES